VTAPGAGFGGDTNVVRLIDAAGLDEALPVLPKEDVAARILDWVAARAGARAAASAAAGASARSSAAIASVIWPRRLSARSFRRRRSARASASARRIGVLARARAAAAEQVADGADAEVVEAVDLARGQRVARALREMPASSPATARAAGAP
jgi:hypothetical protein